MTEAGTGSSPTISITVNTCCGELLIQSCCSSSSTTSSSSPSFSPSSRPGASTHQLPITSSAVKACLPLDRPRDRISLNVFSDIVWRILCRNNSDSYSVRLLENFMAAKMPGGLRMMMVVVFMGVMMMVEVQAQGTPATFTLGDSLVDVGNNNYFFTLAEANHKPYGIDWPDRQATGRFCNGKVIPDFISEYLGMPYALPVLAPEAKGSNLLHGVNYASAGAGILEETGSIFIGRLTMSQQFGYFQKTKQQLVQVIGEANMEQLVANGIYSFSIGGNDYVNNYLAATTTTRSKYNPAQYQDLLINTFEGQLRTAYSLGMRKFIISNIGPIGCAPSILSSRSPSGACVPEVNNYALGFNSALKPLLQTLQSQLPNSVFVLTNAYEVVSRIVRNPLQYGFTDPPATACCGVGKFNGIDGACRSVGNLCTDRSKAVFWDAFHPTEKVNEIASEWFLNGGEDVITPMNVKQLLAL